MFSIIVVTYNRPDFLKECLQSVKEQTYTNYEVFVVDRGSIPSAESIVENLCDNRFKYIQSSQEIHFCDAVNSVVAKTKGKYLCVFGDDDVMNLKTLSIVKHAFEKNKDSDIIMVGSASLIKNNKDTILLPGHISTQDGFPYFKASIKTYKFSGKEWLEWILSAQFIGPKMKCNCPAYIHPSVCFLRKSENFAKVVEMQNGIAVKPSFDSGYLGLAYYTNVIFINAPLVVITFGINNVSIANRRMWDKETKDIKYMPKISQLENRGADSLLNVLHLNKIEKEFNINIQLRLYRKILNSIVKEPIWDLRTFKDLVILFVSYFRSSVIKVDVIYEYIIALLRGIHIHFLKRNHPEIVKSKPKGCLTAQKVSNAINANNM